MQVATLMKKFEAVMVENQLLKQELDKIQIAKEHQQDLDKVKQELDDLKQVHHEQKKELREAKEKTATLERKFHPFR